MNGVGWVRSDPGNLIAVGEATPEMSAGRFQGCPTEMTGCGQIAAREQKHFDAGWADAIVESQSHGEFGF